MPDSVSVRIPADTPHIALLRAAASALSARLDFPVDRITELQIAVDEVCSRLMAVSQAPTSIAMVFDVEHDRSIRLRAEVDGPRREDRDLLSEWSRVILEAIARDIAADLSDGRTALSLRVAKAAR
jgi:serine/threonine-protein kinase RsbW